MNQPIIIIGAGGFGREVLALIQNINEKENRWEVSGFVDDGKQPGEVINGVKVLGGVDYLNSIKEKAAVAIAIAQPAIRRQVIEKLNNPNLYFPLLAHPSSLISSPKTVNIADGCILCANTVLTTDITLGRFVIMNVASTLAHDVQVGDFCTLMPGVNISTGAQLGEGCYIGTGAKIAQPVNIPPWQNISAGAIIA